MKIMTTENTVLRESTGVNAPVKFRIPVLDYLRILACYIVLLYHYTFRGGVRGGWSGLKFSEIDWLTRYGYLGVELFFIISGFVIALTSRTSTPYGFFRSRAIRLLPTYWICCTITFLLCRVAVPDLYRVSTSDFLCNLSMISAFLRIPAVDGVYWTLWVEITFYLLVFVVICSGLSGKLEGFAILWLLVSLALIVFPSYTLTRWSLADRCPWFVVGIVSYYVFADGVTLKRIVVLTGCYAVGCWHLEQHSLYQSVNYSVNFNRYIIFAISGAFVIGFATLRFWHLKFRESELIRFAGLATYPIYLLHQNVGFVIMRESSLFVGRYMSVVVAGVVVTALSSLLLLFLEPTVKGLLSRVLREGAKDSS